MSGDFSHPDSVAGRRRLKRIEDYITHLDKLSRSNLGSDRIDGKLSALRWAVRMLKRYPITFIEKKEGVRMNKRILKYSLSMETGVPQVMGLPLDGIIRTLQMQDGIPRIWVETTRALGERTQERTFCFFGTGWDIPGDSTYVGTVQDRKYVWHLFELGR